MLIKQGFPSTGQLMLQQVSSMAKQSFLILTVLDLIFKNAIDVPVYFKVVGLHANSRINEINVISMTVTKALIV